MGRAQVADRPEQVWRQDPVAYAETRRDRLRRPRVQTRHHGVIDVALGQARVLQCGGEGLPGERHVELLTEALLPDVGVGLTGYTPTVEKFVARRTASDELGHRTVWRAHERGSAVAAGQHTLTTGLVQNFAEDRGTYSIARGEAIFEASAHSTEPGGAVAAADTFLVVSHADFIIENERSYGGHGSNDAWAGSELDYVAIDIKGWSPTD